MSFNSEHLDEKLSELSLQDIRSAGGGGNDGSMTGSGFGEARVRTAMLMKPQKSLLSSSLASEKRTGGTPEGSMQFGGTFPQSLTDQSMFFDGMRDGPDGERMYMDGHPEPELLASSVGKEIEGVLVPSTSNISLLSLSGHQASDIEGKDQLGLHASTLVSPKGVSNVNSYSHIAMSSIVDRKNSYNNLLSRNSLSQINQKRLQPYQNFASPPPQNVSSFQQEHGINHSTSQSIPITKPNMNVPDSPNLNPTSLGGSPSRFWLSSQTPPRSMAGSYNRNSRTQLYSLSTTQPMFIPSRNNYTTTGKKTGDSSPILNPVQTPSEDPPMTPLFLNGNHMGQTTSYFQGFGETQNEPSNIDEELEDEGNEEDPDESKGFIMSATITQ